MANIRGSLTEWPTDRSRIPSNVGVENWKKILLLIGKGNAICITYHWWWWWASHLLSGCKYSREKGNWLRAEVLKQLEESNRREINSFVLLNESSFPSLLFVLFLALLTFIAFPCLPICIEWLDSLADGLSPSTFNCLSYKLKWWYFPNKRTFIQRQT